MALEKVSIEEANKRVRQQLFDTRGQKEHAYAPYSGFMVGASLKTGNFMFYGRNIEMPATEEQRNDPDYDKEYNKELSIHAEQMAVLQWYNDRFGITKNLQKRYDKFERLMISTSHQKGEIPCKKCLSVIEEFAEVDDTYTSTENLMVYSDGGDHIKKVSFDEAWEHAYESGDRNEI